MKAELQYPDQTAEENPIHNFLSLCPVTSVVMPEAGSM